MPAHLGKLMHVSYRIVCVECACAFVHHAQHGWMSHAPAHPTVHVRNTTTLLAAMCMCMRMWVQGLRVLLTLEDGGYCDLDFVHVKQVRRAAGSRAFPPSPHPPPLCTAGWGAGEAPRTEGQQMFPASVSGSALHAPARPPPASAPKHTSTHTHQCRWPPPAPRHRHRPGL